VQIIASGPHNSNKVKLNLLNGMQPPPPRSIVSSFRTISGAPCADCRARGLGESVYKSGLEDGFSWPLFIGVVAVLGIWAYRDLR
jgi:hypothetical protein